MLIPAAQPCILSRYLQEQEVSCWNMAITANADLPHAAEWKMIAALMATTRHEHMKRCGKCAAVVNGTHNPKSRPS